MSKWIDGLPKEKGIFWLNILGKSFVLNNTIEFVFGRGGSFPLELFPKIKNISYKPVKPLQKAGKWISQWNKEDGYGWILSPDGHYGFGIISESNHGVRATISYLFNERGSINNEWLFEEDNWLFQPVKFES